MMYGKSFESMYEGSMVGAGLNVFAVWNYIIAKARRGVIELNPKLLAFRLGGTESEVIAAMEYLERPDAESRTKAEDGRRIIREGQFQFRVVNWESYQRIKNEDDRREYNRVKQSEYRARTGKRPKRGKVSPTGREVRFVKAHENGDDALADSIAAEGLPAGID